ISYILKDSKSSLILTGSQYVERGVKLAAGTGIQSLDISTSDNPVSEENQVCQFDPTKIAYIMYTSGSTGQPKGVIQNHKNILYYTRNWIRFFSITDKDRLSLYSSFCHDGSVQDMFAGLLTGATLCPYYMRNRGNSTGGDLSEFMKNHNVTLWHSVPSLFSYFSGTLAAAGTFPQIRLILLGGEPMRKHELDMCNKHFPNAQLANVYGQTESSVSSIWLVKPGESFQKLFIGTPLDKTRIFLVNERGKKALPFETGEITVASPHLSPGYWGNEPLTKQVFSSDSRLGKLYRTGDQGRLMLDGSIEF
ncbi:MAG: AMP-binding protein, partial [bacterium]|nr:AMP-binding protein [bacterium]